MLGSGSEIFSKQMFFFDKKRQMKIESIRTNWRVLPSWKLTYFSLWEINIIFQPLPLNGICDRFLEGKHRKRATQRFVQRFVDVNLVKRLRFVSFWIVKRFVSNAQLSKSSHNKRSGSRKTTDFRSFFWWKVPTVSFLELTSQGNQQKVPAFQEVGFLFLSLWDRSMLTWSLRVVIFGKGSACCNSKSGFFVQLRSWNNRDARYVHDSWSSHGNLQIMCPFFV